MSEAWIVLMFLSFVSIRPPSIETDAYSRLIDVHENIVNRLGAHSLRCIASADANCKQRAVDVSCHRSLTSLREDLAKAQDRNHLMLAMGFDHQASGQGSFTSDSSRPSMQQTLLDVTPEMFGAKGDYTDLSCSITEASNIATCPRALFGSSDLGKRLFIAGAGRYGYQRWLDTTISAVLNGASVRLAAPASQTAIDRPAGYGHDDNLALQSCWNYSSISGSACRLTGHKYLFDSTSLEIRAMMHVSGAASELTVLVCGPSVINSRSVYVSTARECVINGDIITRFFHLDHFSLWGVEGLLKPPPSLRSPSLRAEDIKQTQRAFLNQVQTAIHIDVEAPTPSGTSVFEMGDLESIEVAGFWGDQLWLDGYAGSACAYASCPSQFNTFKQMHFRYPSGSDEWRPPVVLDAAGHPINGANLVFSGQNDQINFEGGELNGTSTGFHGINVISNGCSVCNFWGESVQMSEYGIVINSAQDLHFDEGWIESVQHVLTDYGPRNGDISVDHNYMGNVGHTTENAGWLLYTHSQDTELSMSHNRIIGHLPDIGVKGNCGAPAVNPSIMFEHNDFGDNLASLNSFGVAYTRCITAQIPVAPSLTLTGSNLTEVNGDGRTIITTINSQEMSGSVSIQAFGGPLNFGGGGNLDLGSLTSPVTVNTGGVVTFKWEDLTGIGDANRRLVLISCSGCTAKINMPLISEGLGGSALSGGQCATRTMEIASATFSDLVAITPLTYPGDGFMWQGYVRAPGKVVLEVCAVIGGTPKLSKYVVRVIH